MMPSTVKPCLIKLGVWLLDLTGIAVVIANDGAKSISKVGIVNTVTFPTLSATVIVLFS